MSVVSVAASQTRSVGVLDNQENLLTENQEVAGESPTLNCHVFLLVLKEKRCIMLASRQIFPFVPEQERRRGWSRLAGAFSWAR